MGHPFQLKLGKFAGGNPQLIRALKSGSIKQPFTGLFCWVQRVQVGDFTGEGDTDQTLDLAALYPRNPFPENVDIDGAYIVRETDFEGTSITDVDIELGDTGDPNGLLTSTAVEAGEGTKAATTGAAEFARHYEAAFLPTLRIVTTGANVSALSAGSLLICIRFRPSVG